MMTIAEILNTLEQALKESTQGVWEHDWQQPLVNISANPDTDKEEPIANSLYVHDAAFIVAAHTHLPSVLAEVKRLQGEVTAIKTAVRQAVNFIHTDEAEGGSYDKGMRLLCGIIEETK